MTSYNAIFIAFGNFFRQACFFLAQIHIANSIGIGSFGLYSTLFSIILIWEAFGSLGTRVSLWKHIAKKPFYDDSKIIFYVVSRLIIAFICLALSYVFLSLVNFDESKFLFYFLIIILFNQSTFDWIFLSKGEASKVVIYNITAGILYLTSLYIYFLFDNNILMLPFIFSLSFLLPGLYLIKNDIFNFKAFKLISLFRFQKILIMHSKVYFGYDLIQRIYLSLPIILTFYVTNPALAGEFRLVSLIIMLAVTLSTSLAFGFFNKIISYKNRDQNNSLSKALLLIFILVIPPSFYFEDILSINFFRIHIPNILDISDILYAVNVLGFIAFANILRELLLPLGKTSISSTSLVIFFIIFTILTFSYEVDSIITLINFLVISEIFSLIFMLIYVNVISLCFHLIKNIYSDAYIFFSLVLLCTLSLFFELRTISIVMPIMHLFLVYRYVIKSRVNE